MSARQMIAAAAPSVVGQQSKRPVIFVSADQANFHDTGNGVSMAAIWGDADKGAHATFTKFVPGYDAGMHTHTNDVWLVVVKGAYLYKDDAGEKRLPCEPAGDAAQRAGVDGGKGHGSPTDRPG